MVFEYLQSCGTKVPETQIVTKNANCYQECSIDIGMGVLTSWSDLVGLEHLILRIQFGKNDL